LIAIKNSNKMKKLKIAFILSALFLISPLLINAQISVNINIGSQPTGALKNTIMLTIIICLKLAFITMFQGDSIFIKVETDGFMPIIYLFSFAATIYTIPIRLL